MSVAVGARLVFVVTLGMTDALPLYELIHFCLVMITEIAVYCGSPVKTCVWDLTKTEKNPHVSMQVLSALYDARHIFFLVCEHPDKNISLSS